MNNPKIIAFYLPQYYPTPTNNANFGSGFTEWTNVAKAVPLFKGHYQPKIPADLGFYDLRYSEIRIQQAEMAKEAGIDGFCYYHYWFGKGKMELELPFANVINSGKPDFPFCLCWANQSWYSKFWNKDAECEHKLVVEQNYDDEEWIENHFNYLLKAFKDERYLKIDGKPIFMIYRPLEYSQVCEFMRIWNNLAKKNNLKGIYFMAQAVDDNLAKRYLNMGFDGVNIVRKDDFLKSKRYSNKFVFLYNKIIRLFGGAPYHYDYAKIYKYFVKKNGIENEEHIYPTLIPNWDHSPRSGKRGSIFYNSTPENFEKHLKEVLKVVKDKKLENIVFLKSWNEWGEGNYIEPDLKYGHGFLDVLKRNINRR